MQSLYFFLFICVFLLYLVLLLFWSTYVKALSLFVFKHHGLFMFSSSLFCFLGLHCIFCLLCPLEALIAHVQLLYTTFPIVLFKFMRLNDFVWFNSFETEDACSRGQPADQSRTWNLLSCIQFDISVGNYKNYKDV